MRIFWWSNAIWTHTGYGGQTRTFVPRVKALGHELIMGANYGLDGAILNLNNDIKIYPRGTEAVGNDILAAHAAKVQADIVLTLYDTWGFRNQSMESFKWVPWMPVDHEPLPRAIGEAIRPAWMPIAYARFGQRMLHEAGFEALYVPHGIDTEQFKPVDRAKARELLGFPPDKFVGVMVAANKGFPCRKAFPEVLMAWREFVRGREDDVMLYLHSHDGPQLQGLDLQQTLMDMDYPRHAVKFCDPYQNTIGYPDAFLRDVYNAADVLISPSWGEGFGLPIVEAQACGCPVIVGDWTSMAELCGAGWKIAKEDAHPFYTPIGAWQFIPSIDAIGEALENAWAARGNQKLRNKARKFAMRYDADFVTRTYWKPVLEELEDRLKAAQQRMVPVTVEAAS